MTLVKICSITNSRDARAAVDAGADFLGFIAVPNTPRYVTPTRYARIVATLPKSVRPVLVVRDVVDALPYNPVIVQYYGGNPSTLAPEIDLLPVIRPKTTDDLSALTDLPSRAIGVIVDAYHPDTLGGAGQVGDWSVVAEAISRTSLPVFLAGGLTAENVCRAIREVSPAGVDVSSGVEEKPGRKDHAKVKAFIASAKSC